MDDIVRAATAVGESQCRSTATGETGEEGPSITVKQLLGIVRKERGGRRVDACCVLYYGVLKQQHHPLLVLSFFFLQCIVSPVAIKDIHWTCGE